jgi:hypothetical protein
MGTPLSLTKGEVSVGKLITREGIVFGDGSVMTSGVESVPVVTSQVYVDYLRVDSYTPNGTREYPYKTLATAKAKAETLSPSGSNPIRIILISGNTSATAENLTFNNGHLWITAEASSGTHAPVLFYGSLTFNGSASTISDNHFSISGLMLNGISGTTVVTFSGTNPQRLFMKDVWITANGTAHGVTMTNTGTASSIHTNDCKFSHNGSGAYHCINITAGTANLDSIETSGAVVGVIGVDGGSCNLSNSEIESAGAYAIDVYAGGYLSAANTKIVTTAANSIGIKLVAATAVAALGNISFNVPTSATTGRAISGVSGSFLFYTSLYFVPDGAGTTTNTKIDTVITRAVISSTPSFV